MGVRSSSKVLLVGRSSVWRQRAAEHLAGKGVIPVPVEHLEEAADRVRSDPSLTAVILAEDHNREAMLANMARMVVARPELPLVVLAVEYDLQAMVQYLRLGQRGADPCRVRYYPNEYDYDHLETLIRDEEMAAALALKQAKASAS